MKVKSFESEEEVIIACDQLTREGILSSYGKVGSVYQLRVKAREKCTAINLIENSSTLRNYNYFRNEKSEDV